MTLRIARFILGIVAAIIIVTPLMPQVALSHESATVVQHNFGALSFYVDDEIAPDGATLDAETYALLEFIINLSDSQAALFQEALNLADDRQALTEFLVANGPDMLALSAALPSGAMYQTGTVDENEPLSDEERELLDHCGSADPLSGDWWECFLGHIVVDPISSLIGGISTTVGTIANYVTEIFNDVAAFVEDAAQKIADFGQDVMTFFQETTDAAFGWIAEIRARFLSWMGSSCDAASPCGQFRAQLGTFFADIVGIEQTIAAMIGPVAFRLPGVSNNQAAVQQALGVIPDFMLWPLAEVLDLLPVDWSEIPTRVGAMLPDVGPNAMTPWEIINDAENSGQPFDLCAHISADGSGNITPLPHSNMDIYAMSLLTSGLGIVGGYIPNDLTIDVLGEGTTVMAHPLKVVFTGINQFVDLVATAMGQVNDLDTTCATAAFRTAIIDQLNGIDTQLAALGGDQLNLYIEDQLTLCTVIVTLYLPAANGGQLEVVRDLVDALILQVEGAGFNTGNARALHNQGLADMSAGEYRRAYMDFCSSYRSLRFGGAGSVSYTGTGEVWACVSNFTGTMRRVDRDESLQPGDPDYYLPPIGECSANERLVEVYGYEVSATRGGGGGRQ